MHRYRISDSQPRLGCLGFRFRMINLVNGKGNMQSSAYDTDGHSGYPRAMKNHFRSGASLPLLAFSLTILGSCHSSGPTLASSSAAPTKKWEFSTGALHQVPRGDFFDDQSPAIGSNGTLYVPGNSGLYAVRPDGTQKWFYRAQYQSPAFPIRFVLVDDNGNIWCDETAEVGRIVGGAMELDPDGNQKPGAVSRERVSQLSEAYDGTVFVAMGGSAVPVHIDGKGADLSAHIVGYFFSFAQDGTTYAVLDHGLAAYSRDRSTKWLQNIDAGGEPALASDGTIYVGGNGVLTALNADGSGKWSFSLKGHLVASPAIATDGTLYFGSADGSVYALDPNGKVKWKFSTGGEILSTPALAKNGTVYLGGTDHNLYAIGSDGKLKWEFATGGQVFSPTIADDGTIYFQNGEGKLFAIQDTESNGGLDGQWPKRGAGSRNTARGIH
jgi:outer membrane protein assembly factor BamB